MHQASSRIKTWLFFVLLMARVFLNETHAQRTQAASVTRGASLCGEYLSTLNAYDRRILINLILSEIAYFRRPEIK